MEEKDRCKVLQFMPSYYSRIFSLHSHATVFIGEEDTMVNKILVVDKIVHLGPPLGHCRGLLYKIVW